MGKKEKFEDASKRFLGIDNLWSYLNKLYGFQIAKTSLKYIDEYLWIRITKELYWNEKIEGKLDLRKVLESKEQILPPPDFLALVS